MANENNEAKCGIRGVRCHVENCAHHSRGNICTAASIDVRNEDALTKAETFCGTFTPEDTWHISG